MDGRSPEALADADYDFAKIEAKWQSYWAKTDAFRSGEPDGKPKYYVLDMFPYPSGDGLHVGHVEGYTATDIVARYKRMRGFNVLHPMGWDAFGLPAEQFAIKTGRHPANTTRQNVDRFRQQIKSIGLSYDWSREVDTTDPSYYRWTQWIFLKLHERGLAYQADEAVNWCPELGTVLANEEVVDGKSEVGGHPVEKRRVRQWVLKITAYAERLLDDLDGLDWPESLKEMQRHWIGKSQGAYVDFSVDLPGGGDAASFRIFTTRPDTLFGATFCVLSPEHPLVGKLTTKASEKSVLAYIAAAKTKSDVERTAANQEKTGVFTGSYAVNPVNGEKVPVWLADYVLATYGTGAIMAVPGHDERDHAFARRFELPIKRVLTGGTVADIHEAAHEGDGTLVNSGFLNGKDKATAIAAMGAWLEAQGKGRLATTYKLRDWLFSRQRYWGEPFPVLHGKDGDVTVVDAKDLPVRLPELEDFKPTGSPEGPLLKAKDWLIVTRDGKEYRRETNTMPQWAGSCWYYLRYIDPHNSGMLVGKEVERYWMPVDLYIGGAEHAVLHLLYARFWHKVLFDCGVVSTKEPFQKLVNQGMILGENHEKMSKSRGNTVNPDDLVRDAGADSLRLYEMFMGPLTATKPWQTAGIAGVHRFLKRAFRLIVDESGRLTAKLHVTESQAFTKLRHMTIRKVTEDTEALAFNTAIAAMMEFVNGAYKEPHVTKDSLEALTLLLAPYAPHLSEELWERLGHRESLCRAPWPQYDPALTEVDSVTISVQVNGKLRGTLVVAKDAPAPTVIKIAKSDPTIMKHLEEKTIAKEIFVPGKVLNFVVR